MLKIPVDTRTTLYGARIIPNNKLGLRSEDSFFLFIEIAYRCGTSVMPAKNERPQPHNCRSALLTGYFEISSIHVMQRKQYRSKHDFTIGIGESEPF